MVWTQEQLESYEKDGFLFLPDYFSREEVERMKAEVPAILAEDSPRRVLEKKDYDNRALGRTQRLASATL